MSLSLLQTVQNSKRGNQYSLSLKSTTLQFGNTLGTLGRKTCAKRQYTWQVYSSPNPSAGLKRPWHDLKVNYAA